MTYLQLLKTAKDKQNDNSNLKIGLAAGGLTGGLLLGVYGRSEKNKLDNNIKTAKFNKKNLERKKKDLESLKSYFDIEAKLDKLMDDPEFKKVFGGGSRGYGDAVKAKEKEIESLTKNIEEAEKNISSLKRNKAIANAMQYAGPALGLVSAGYLTKELIEKNKRGKQ